MLTEGLSYTSTMTVEPSHLAIYVGSGDLEVLSTPMMMALMENAAMLAVRDALEEGQTTVGGFISSSHLKPTPVGNTICATAELVGIDGRKLTFKVTAEDSNGVIGEGEHIRYIVDAARFMAKLQ
jgi:predicted thioesterase